MRLLDSWAAKFTTGKHEKRNRIILVLMTALVLSCLIIPNQHFENIYDLPASLAGEIHRVARDIALALKATYACDGVSTRQHNELAGNQHVWHYHLHVFPRYGNDNLYFTHPRATEPA